MIATTLGSRIWPKLTWIYLWSCRNINTFDHRVLFQICWRRYIINISIILFLSKQRILNSEKTSVRTDYGPIKKTSSIAAFICILCLEASREERYYLFWDTRVKVLVTGWNLSYLYELVTDPLHVLVSLIIKMEIITKHWKS